MLVPLRANNPRFPIKGFLVPLVDLLADADSQCREASRTALATLFATASPAAKGDLKREMEAKSVRKPLMDGILKAVLGDLSDGFSSDGAPNGAVEAPQPGPSVITAASSTTADESVAPVYVASRHDLDQTFATMRPYFNSREDEHNWASREKSVIKIRGMLRAKVHSQFRESFADEIRQMTDGILKAVASLRTTLAIHGITLVSELANHMGDDLADSTIESSVPALLRMAGFTKRIVATATQSAVSTIFTNVAYRHKFLSWVSLGMADKTVLTRVAMVEHLRTLLVTHTRQKPAVLESHDGLSLIVQMLGKALTDQNKDVRSGARAAFYVFRRQWTARGDALLDTLDPAARKQVVAGMDASDTATAPSQSPRSNKVIRPPSAVPSRGAAPAAGGSGGAGPSSAIVAAKRAAAARMAEQRRLEAQQAQQVDDDVEQEGDETEQATPVKSGATPFKPSRSGGFMPSRPGSSSVNQQSQSSSSPLGDEKIRADSSSRVTSQGVGSSAFWQDDGDGAEDDTVQLGGNSPVRPNFGGDADASATMDLMGASMLPSVGNGRGATNLQGDDESMMSEATPIQRKGKPSSPADDGRTRPTTNGQPFNVISALQQSNAQGTSAAAAAPRTPAAPPTRPTGGQGWFHDRVSRLEVSMMSSPLKSKPDALGWVEGVKAKKADVKTFRNLAKLSGAFKVSSPVVERDEDGGEEHTTQLTRGPRATAPGQADASDRSQGLKQQLQGEADAAFSDDGFGDDDMVRQQTEAWREGQLFERLFDALENFFGAGSGGTGGSGSDALPLSATSSVTTAALILLHKLVENQYPLLPALGLEGRLVKLVLVLVSTTNNGTRGGGTDARAVAMAAEAILLQAWVQRTVAALGLSNLISQATDLGIFNISDDGTDGAAATFSNGSKGMSKTRCFCLSAFARLFRRLPTSVVVEDEMPRVRQWILCSLNDQDHIELRQATVQVLVAACHELDVFTPTSGAQRAELNARSQRLIPTSSNPERKPKPLERSDFARGNTITTGAAEAALKTALGEGALKREQMDLVLYYLERDNRQSGA